MQRLRCLSLLRNEAFVHGKWLPATSGRKFDITNPANGQVITSVPDMEVRDAEHAVDVAYEAFHSWKHTTSKERSAILQKWFSLVEEHKEDLAVLMTLECGKPLVESMGEIGYGASFLEFFAEEAKRIYGEVVQTFAPKKEVLILRQPIGVASLITPWNFPNAMITRKAGAALAAGCTCVVKPAEDTPLSALALAFLAEQAGVPPGVFNVVTSSRKHTPAVGSSLCKNTKVAGISFTGSTVVGKLLFKQVAEGIKRIGLELGGNAPFIVYNSANLKVAVDALMIAKFRNTGQTCISANRILIQSGVYNKFIEMVRDAMKTRLVVGDGLEPATTQGPLINESQFAKVSGIVSESVERGAKLLCGGRGHSLGGLFYEPTILADVNENMPCHEMEIFGPVVAFRRFETEDESLHIANTYDSGLAGYIFTQDVSQMFRVSRELEVGMLGINEGHISGAEVPFGGIKESGIGREGSRHGIDDYTYIKYMCIGGIN